MWKSAISPRNLASCRRINLVSGHLKMFSSGSTAGNEEVILETKNYVGLITLHRPKALNSLNLEMIRKIHPQLKIWESDPKIGAIIIKGAGEKAFCAGGDVRAVAEAGLVGGRLTKDFFREEYQLNNAIGIVARVARALLRSCTVKQDQAGLVFGRLTTSDPWTLKTPFVALINGITMGGGVGLSVHGHFRIGTEKSLFAMPETAIGLFPDVGGSFFLPKLQGQLGTYLSLTGERLKGYDVHLAGVATHYVSSDKMAELEENLTSMEHPTLKTILQLVEGYHRDSVSKLDGEFSLAPYLDTINRCFDKNTMEEIITALEQERSDWAKSKIDLINKMSPTSLKVTLKQLRDGAKLRTLFECLTMEYRLSQRFMEDKDFYEGIRAVLVDRDNNPKWNPDTLRGVNDEKVNSYFASLGENELEF